MHENTSESKPFSALEFQNSSRNIGFFFFRPTSSRVFLCNFLTSLSLQIQLQALKVADSVNQPLSRCWNVFVSLATCKENVA